MSLTTPITLQHLMLGAALLGLTSLKAYHAAWFVRKMEEISRLTITQRKRYGWIAIGQLMAGIFPVACLIMFGPTTYLNAIAEFWGVSPRATIISAANVIALTTPLLTVLTAISVYRNPAELAHAVQGVKSYVRTDDARLASVPRPRRQTDDIVRK